jgi:hypothetical protein
MKQPWWALLIVAVFGIGAGVGAATLFGGETGDADAAAEEAPDTSAVPETTSAPSTSEPAATTTTVPPTTSSTTTSTTTTSTSTTVAPTTTVPPVQPPLEQVQIVVANGAGIPLIAGITADQLRTIGYPVVEIADGGVVSPTTAMFVADGLQPTADQVIADLLSVDPAFVVPTQVAPLAESLPVLPAFPDAAIVLYLGQDQG